MRIIFDLDGTLFMTLPCALKGVETLFSTLGIEKPEEEFIAGKIGLTSRNFLREILPKTIEVNDEVLSLYRKVERQTVAEKGQVFEGIQQMLQTLCENNHELVICSNGSMDYIELVTKSTGINEYFSAFFSAKDYSEKAEAVARCFTSREDTILIGDTSSDFYAAKKNGIPVIAAAYGYSDWDDMKEADYRVENVADIVTVVAQVSVLSEAAKSIKDKKVVGISGVDTSGKTEFTKNLAIYLRSIGIKVSVLHMDDFLNPMEVRRCGKTENEAYYNNAFNAKQVVEEVLKPLRSKGNLDQIITCLNVDTDCYEVPRHYVIDTETILLVEGVLLFRPPVDDYLDLRIFLSVDFDEVIRRATLRDVPKYGEAFLQKYRDKYIPISKQYFNEWKPEERSKIVIDNNDWTNPFFKNRMSN